MWCKPPSTVVSWPLISRWSRRSSAGRFWSNSITATERLRANEARSHLSALAHQRDALQAEIDAAKAALVASQFTARAALEEAQAQLRQAHVAARFATQEAQRAQELHARGYLSEADWQRAQAQAEQAQSTRERLRLAVSRLQQEHTTQARDRQVSLEALIRQRTRLEGEQITTQRTLERLTYETSRRRILAPVTGRIGETRPLRQGSVVEEGDMLAAVVPAGDLMVVADFSRAAALGRLQRGQPARLRLNSFHWAQYGTVAATVARVASEAHNGRVRVELQVPPAPAAFRYPSTTRLDRGHRGGSGTRCPCYFGPAGGWATPGHASIQTHCHGCRDAKGGAIMTRTASRRCRFLVPEVVQTLAMDCAPPPSNASWKDLASPSVMAACAKPARPM